MAVLRAPRFYNDAGLTSCLTGHRILQAGGQHGAFGVPTDDPVLLDATRNAQEFAEATFVFGTMTPFAVPHAAWLASVAGRALVGLPKGPSQTLDAASITFVPHDQGVV